MLIVTNRVFEPKFANEKLLSKAYVPFSAALNCCEVSAGSAGWKAGDVGTDLTDADLALRFQKLFAGSRPVLLFIHGNNNAPADCFARCAALEEQYGVAVVGFSWTSEGFQPDGSDLAGIDTAKASTDIADDSLADVNRGNLQEGWIQRKARRYGQAKVNGQHSASALARSLRLLASARLGTMTQPFSVAVHSLGNHFLHYAIEHDGAAESLAVAHNVALLAGCTGAAKHAAWVGRITPVRKTYISYTKADSVLAAARVVDGDVKLGTDPGADRLAAPRYRYIDFEGAAKMKLGAHRYFVADTGKKLSKQARLLFERIFQSRDDLNPGESEKVVYPLACSTDKATCYMGSVGTPDAGG